MLQPTPSAVLFKDLLFSVHCLLIISECWRKQKAKEKQAPMELENIPAVRQTQIGWVFSQKGSQEREQSLLLQEKGQLVSEAHGRVNRGGKAWDRNLEKIAPWKQRTCEQAASFKGQECALTGWHVLAWGDWENCPTLNLTPLRYGCPWSCTHSCSFTAF